MSTENFEIGDLVLAGGSLGNVCKPERDDSPGWDGVWVFVFSKGYASCYDVRNVRKLFKKSKGLINE